MNYKLLMNTALLAGEILLTSGAETNRVEDTINRILMTSRLEKSETLAISTGIFALLEDNEKIISASLRRVKKRDTNLNNIHLVNNISRNLCSGSCTLEQAYEGLKNINEFKQYNKTLIFFCNLVTASSFALLFGGRLYECLLAAANGAIIFLVGLIKTNKDMNRLLIKLFQSFLMAVFSASFVFLTKFDISIETVIAGSIMALVPGVALTNAIRDLFHGDYLSGGARFIEAFVTVTFIAIGFGLGLFLGDVFWGGLR